MHKVKVSVIVLSNTIERLSHFRMMFSNTITDTDKSSFRKETAEKLDSSHVAHYKDVVLRESMENIEFVQEDVMAGKEFLTKNQFSIRNITRYKTQ